MRAAFLWCFLTVYLSTGLGAQSTPSQASASEPLRLIKLPELSVSPAKPAEGLYAPAFSPANPVPTPATTLAAETRSPAQLEALLATYVGTWRGESSWYNLTTHQTTTLPTEMAYKLQKQNGHNVLTCTMTYHNHGMAQVTLSRLWVENGHIFSETAQDGVSQKYVAQSRGSALTWRIFGSLLKLIDFGEIETLRLTPSGGEISSHGFEVEYSSIGESIVLESAELKLVK